MQRRRIEGGGFKRTASQIRLIITKLIKTGLSIQQNWPVLTGRPRGIEEIAITGNPPLSTAMKNIPYKDIYTSIESERAFHVKMLDGALIQMCYRFNQGRIESHRLCMFPAPDLDSFDFDPEPYDRDEVYADIVGRNVVHFPIRFDFDQNPLKHVDVKHPKSHMTLGQYPNCRIPVSAPLAPAKFIKFILRNFYHTRFYSSELEHIDSPLVFSDTISAGERSVTHVIG
jgi:hypothetical protein